MYFGGLRPSKSSIFLWKNKEFLTSSFSTAGASSELQKAPKTAPRRLQSCSKTASEAPREPPGTPHGHPKPAQKLPRANPRPQGSPKRRPRVPRDIERYQKQPKGATKKSPTTTTPKGDNHNDNHNDKTTRPTTGEKQPTTTSRITQHPYDTARRNARSD